MTRDEAIVICKELYETHVTDNAPNFVDELVKRGILKLDEPVFLDIKINKALGATAGWVRETLKSAGLQITEKQEH